MRSTEKNNLARYEEWLLERRLAAEHQLAHFRRWVNRFLYLRGSRPMETWQDTLIVFLEDLGEGQYLPWQVRQAGDGVTLYCGQFCANMGTRVLPEGTTREGGANRGAGRRKKRVKQWARLAWRWRARLFAQPQGRSVARAGAEWRRVAGGGEVLTNAELLAEMRRILRLRHYAGSTERSYLGWCRRFLQYVGRSGEHAPTGDDVQAFLNHLAVQCKVSASTQNQELPKALIAWQYQVYHAHLSRPMIGKGESLKAFAQL